MSSSSSTADQSKNPASAAKVWHSFLSASHLCFETDVSQGSRIASSPRHTAAAELRWQGAQKGALWLYERQPGFLIPGKIGQNAAHLLIWVHCCSFWKLLSPHRQDQPALWVSGVRAMSRSCCRLAFADIEEDFLSSDPYQVAFSIIFLCLQRDFGL